MELDGVVGSFSEARLHRGFEIREVVGMKDAELPVVLPVVLYRAATAGDHFSQVSQGPSDVQAVLQRLSFVALLPGRSVGASGEQGVPDSSEFLSHFVFLQLVEIE